MHIDAIGPVDEHDHVTFAHALYDPWHVRGEERTVEETKLNAIARFGEVAEGLMERAAEGERVQSPAYGTLFDIGGKESSYPIRLAIARVTAAGGDRAYDAIFHGAEPADAKSLLCPYPPKGAVAYRVELSEAFCRRRRNLLRGGAVRGRTAPWQESLAKELRAFWATMEARARA